MTTTQISFDISAIPADDLAAIRTSGLDVSGIDIAHVVASGGEPLRCCLRDAEAGADLILFGYAPSIPVGPYREVGPVFAHAHECGGPANETYPSGWRGRPQVLRAYDARGWIHPATRVHDGTDPVGMIADVLADPTVAQVHSRNVTYGCYMFRITRTEDRHGC